MKALNFLSFLLGVVCFGSMALATTHANHKAATTNDQLSTALDQCQPGMLTSIQHLTCAQAQASVKARNYRDGDDSMGVIYHCPDNAPIGVAITPSACADGYSAQFYTTPTADDANCLVGYTCIDR